MSYVLAMQVLFLYVLANLLGFGGGCLAVMLLTKLYGNRAGLLTWGTYVLLVVLLTAGYAAFFTPQGKYQEFWNSFLWWGVIAVPPAMIAGGVAYVVAVLMWRKARPD